MVRMAELGIRMAIDNYGTGFSSLGRLHDLPVHSLKIDQGFVRDAAADGSNAAIVESVISVGHRPGMLVVAEGVEDERTLNHPRGRGTDLERGCFLGRPMSADDMTERLCAEGATAGHARLRTAPASLGTPASRAVG